MNILSPNKISLTSTLCDSIFFHCIVALAQAIVSITKVTVMKPTNANIVIKSMPKNQPACANTAGNVSAPVPTIKLKT